MHLIWYLSACKESIIGREISPPLHLIHRHLQISRCPARPNPIIASPGINLQKSGWEIIPAKESSVSITTDAALSIYKSMLLPLFTYCSILNANPSRTHQERIDNFENRAQRIVYRSGNPNRNQQLISVKELNKKRVCLQVFKCMIGETCENFQNYFEIMNNKTRNRNCLIRLRVAKLECYSFCFNGAREFDKLPLKIRSSKTTTGPIE